MLIEALNDAEAREKAMKQGLSEEHEYEVSMTDNVRWIFDSVERVYEIDGQTFSQGLEVFSRFLRDSEVASLKKPFAEG